MSEKSISPRAFASSDFAAVRSLWVAERLQAPRRGARECQGDALAGRGVQPVLRRFAHQLGPVAVSENESGVGRKDIERYMLGGGEEQAIAMHPIVGPFLIGAEILDRGFDLHDPDFAVAPEGHEIGAASGHERQLGDAGQSEHYQQALCPARHCERCWRLTAIKRRDGG